MRDPSSEFIRVALAQGALRFGEFTLKSGRRSPYFFNAGAFNTGGSLAALGRCYAAAIDASGIAFDVLFGPAYKGIPLACAAAISLSEELGRDVPCAFNRKEEKAHGEGGSLIGAPLGGQRVMIVDDVITAGTAVREVVELIRGAGASIAGVIIGLDRDEIGPGGRSAVAEIAEELGAPVLSIARLGDVVRYVEASEVLRGHLPAMREYRERWGAGG